MDEVNGVSFVLPVWSLKCKGIHEAFHLKGLPSYFVVFLCRKANFKSDSTRLTVVGKSWTVSGTIL
jgi:hypothetical protein